LSQQKLEHTPEIVKAFFDKTQLAIEHTIDRKVLLQKQLRKSNMQPNNLISEVIKISQNMVRNMFAIVSAKNY
tara:strand:- start:1306 stop:1524 length:219 start_codon:yes stop_codon:yes gene_type:complete